MASPVQQVVYRFGTFVLDPGSETLRTAAGVRISLRAKSFVLLRLMVENAGRLLTRESVMDSLWPSVFVTDDSITQCVGDIRLTLGREWSHLLRTVRHRGYTLRLRCSFGDATGIQAVAVAHDVFDVWVISHPGFYTRCGAIR